MGDIVELPGAFDITEDKNLGRACRVRWIDSGLHNDSGWAKRAEFIDDDLKVMECETIGLWLGETDDVIVVAQSRDEKNDNWMSAMVIWKRSVLIVEWLP